VTGSSETEVVGEPSAAAFTLVSVRRRLLRGSSWILAGKLITLPLGFLINALLARLLTPAEFGAYLATFTLVFAGSVIAQMGLDTAAVRFVSTSLSAGRPGEARHVIRIVFAAGTISSIGVGLVLVLGIGSWVARSVFHSEILVAVIPVAALWLVVTALQSLMVETFRAFQQFVLATIFDSLLVDVLLAVTLGVLLARRAHPDVRDVVWLCVAFAALVAVIAGSLLLRRVRRLRGGGHLPRREIFAMAWPVLVTNVAIYVLGTGWDVLVLGAFRPLPEVAIYGAASRLMGLAVTPARTLQGVTPPIIAELYAQGRKRELERNLRGAATLAGLPTVVALVVFILFGRSVMGHLYSPFYAQGATILIILTAGRVLAVWTGSCGLVLIMTGHQRAMMYITIFSSVASVTAGLFAAARFGGVGVAVATASTAGMQNILQLVLARRLAGVSTQAELAPRRLLRFLSTKDEREPSDAEPPE
jgi:O-antigen/teichoic acid export membrane protein